MLVSALVNCSVLITSSGVAIAANWSTNDTPSVQAPTRRMVRFNSSAPVTQSSGQTYIPRADGYGAFYTERRRQQYGGRPGLGGVQQVTDPNLGSGVGPAPGVGPGPESGAMNAAESRRDMGASQEDQQMRLQNMMERQSQAQQMQSNMLKKQSETQQSIINNIK